MINIETLLSSFDERGTLLKWLKAVEKALNEATLTSVDVINVDPITIKLKFNFEDGTSIITNEIVTTESIENVEIINNHLIMTLTNGTVIDCGEFDTYTKSEADTLLSAKANANEVYTKSEADTLLSAKANANEVYTKSEADTLLSAKANANDVYTKTEANELFVKKMVLLWTNENATLQSNGSYQVGTNFSAQQVTLSENIEQYDYYSIIYFKSTNASNVYNTGLIPTNQSTTLFGAGSTEQWNVDQTRWVGKPETGNNISKISFGDGYNRNMSSNPSISNNFMIPFKIYGIKNF